MRHHLPVFSMMAVLIASGSTARALDFPDTCRAALNSVKALTGDTAAPPAVESALASQITNLTKPSWAPGYCRAVADNFTTKAISLTEGVSFTAQTLISTGVEFEAFRITSFRNSGVAPKRYFGYLDERGRAVAYETKLKSVVACLHRSLTPTP
jgi:hypothetical protein